MGHGIAYVSAIAGYDVVLFDVSTGALEHALGEIRAAFDAGMKRGRITVQDRDEALSRIAMVSELPIAVQGAAIVFEAVPEQLSLKQQIFALVAASAPSHALLATNTSSLSITTIATAVSTPERVIGMHFFNPVAAMKLVEVVRGDRTSERAVAHAREFAASVGKTAIVVGDTPGFATSRLGVVLGLEAMRMVEQGVGSPSDVDRAMELGYNHPVGPLRLTDMVGLDVRLAVADHLYASFGLATYAAPKLLRDMVAAGKLGKKAGEGFYRWPEEE